MIADLASWLSSWRLNALTALIWLVASVANGLAGRTALAGLDLLLVATFAALALARRDRDRS